MTKRRTHVMRYLVEYSLPYEHIVRVGIEAESAEAALEIAESKFNDGTLWEDTRNTPLIYDDFEEDGDSGVPLQFTVVDERPSDEAWPNSGPCVAQKRMDAHNARLRELVESRLSMVTKNLRDAVNPRDIELQRTVATELSVLLEIAQDLAPGTLVPVSYEDH